MHYSKRVSSKNRYMHFTAIYYHYKHPLVVKTEVIVKNNKTNRRNALDLHLLCTDGPGDQGLLCCEKLVRANHSDLALLYLKDTNKNHDVVLH